MLLWGACSPWEVPPQRHLDPEPLKGKGKESCSPPCIREGECEENWGPSKTCGVRKQEVKTLLAALFLVHPSMITLNSWQSRKLF